jgi:LacI family transcriptional regulator
VAVAPGNPSAEIATVRIDNEAAARELTEHLLGLGHRRFGFIKGHPNQTVSEKRLNGFLTALAEAGIGRESVRIEQGYFTYRSGLEAAEKLLDDSGPLPTAIFAANDDMAAATAALAHRLGYDVPEDLSIVGFDDQAIAVAVWPTLTTVHQPVAAMARASVDLVMEEIRRVRSGVGAPHQLLHPYTLMVRESSGPVPLGETAQASP